MSTMTLTLAEFLKARLDEDEAAARAAASGRWIFETFPNGFAPLVSTADGMAVAETFDKPNLQDARHIARHNPARVLAEVEAKRQILKFHESWPVLVQTQPELENVGSDLSSVTMRMSQQIAWTTTQEYRKRFGDDPPTDAIVRALALPYADHPDYRAEWRP